MASSPSTTRDVTPPDFQPASQMLKLNQDKKESASKNQKLVVHPLEAEAKKIQKNLKKFISDPTKKVKKSNQDYINTKINDLVNMITGLSKDLMRASGTMSATVSAEGQILTRNTSHGREDKGLGWIKEDSNQEATKNSRQEIVNEVIAQVMPQINSSLERMTNQIIEQANKNFNLNPQRIRHKAKQSKDDTKSGLGSSSGISDHASPDESRNITPNLTHPNEPGKESRTYGEILKTPNEVDGNGRDQEWTLFTGRKRKSISRKSTQDIKSHTDILKSLPNTIESKGNSLGLLLKVDVGSEDQELDSDGKIKTILNAVESAPPIHFN